MVKLAGRGVENVIFRMQFCSMHFSMVFVMNDDAKVGLRSSRTHHCSVVACVCFF